MIDAGAVLGLLQSLAMVIGFIAFIAAEGLLLRVMLGRWIGSRSPEDVGVATEEVTLSHPAKGATEAMADENCLLCYGVKSKTLSPCPNCKRDVSK